MPRWCSKLYETCAKAKFSMWQGISSILSFLRILGNAFARPTQHSKTKICEGMPSRDIAQRLCKTPRTPTAHAFSSMYLLKRPQERNAGTVLYVSYDTGTEWPKRRGQGRLGLQNRIVRHKPPIAYTIFTIHGFRPAPSAKKTRVTVRVRGAGTVL